jgi:opacity protein-like surface antigen
MTMKLRLAAAVVAAVAAIAFTPPAAAQQVAGIFGKGRTHFFITGGTGYAFDETYFVLGLGVSYYLVDGLNAGLAFESWSGSDPSMYKITPSLQYVFYEVQTVKPYIGAFYRRTNVDGLPDLDSVGGRAGAYFQAGRNAYIGFGVVYESYLDCSSSVYRNCDSTYPELSFTIAF